MFSHATLPVTLSPTRAELGSRCERRHVLSDILEYGKCKSPSAAFGTVMHAGVGEYWAQMLDGRQLPTVIQAARDEMVTQYAPTMHAACSIGDHTLEMANGMLDVYAQHAEIAGPFTSAGRWTEVALETRIKMPVGDYILSVQQDRTVINNDLDWLITVDLKTASRFSPQWQKQWNHSLQMKLYRYVNLEFYSRGRTDVVIEGLLKGGKPQLRYVPLPDWSRAQLQEAVEQWKRVAEKDRVLIERASVDGVVDIDVLEYLALTETSFNYQDCNSYGMECPFLSLCDADPEYRQGLLHAGYQIIEQDY